MSEYTPITGELREYATVAWDPWPEARDRLCQMCDAIDAIHAQLERENASLKAELDRVLGEQEDRRGCIYYDPERHYCSCHDIDTDALVELPKDADGVPIHVGDVMVYADGNTCPLPVVALVPPAVFLTDDGPRYANMCRHAPDTWERIIDDAEALAREWFNTDMSENEHAEGLDALVARCKALCERTKEAGE
jgi:hypothetical protein